MYSSREGRGRGFDWKVQTKFPNWLAHPSDLCAERAYDGTSPSSCVFIGRVLPRMSTGGERVFTTIKMITAQLRKEALELSVAFHLVFCTSFRSHCVLVSFLAFSGRCLMDENCWKWQRKWHFFQAQYALRQFHAHLYWHQLNQYSMKTLKLYNASSFLSPIAIGQREPDECKMSVKLLIITIGVKTGRFWQQKIDNFGIYCPMSSRLLLKEGNTYRRSGCWLPTALESSC